MRLLNTHTYQIEEFVQQEAPRYAILSHRWGLDETSYHTFSIGRGKDTAGRQKVIQACDFTHEVRKVEWLWIDTCCIDNTSSAELSEAINSMYTYYSEAWECYAYLSDVWSLQGRPFVDVIEDFKRSEWFRRGWTLQELVAPLWVHFCTRHWEVFWTKNWYSDALPQQALSMWKASGTDLISEISRVPAEVLHDPSRCFEYSIAQRISWASRRRTTRIEDEAYCLLGLLDVNMPLLYGERHKAFTRLQQEVLTRSLDETILAWSGTGKESDDRRPQPGNGPLRLIIEHDSVPLLAKSPAQFGLSQQVVQSIDTSTPRLAIEGGLVRLRVREQDECFDVGDARYAIRLRCVDKLTPARRLYDGPIGQSLRLEWRSESEEVSNYQDRDICHLYEDRANANGQILSRESWASCVIELRLESCGHFERLSGRDLRPGFPLSALKRLKNTTFYMHASAECNVARATRRREREATYAPV